KLQVLKLVPVFVAFPFTVGPGPVIVMATDATPEAPVPGSPAVPVIVSGVPAGAVEMGSTATVGLVLSTLMFRDVLAALLPALSKAFADHVWFPSESVVVLRLKFQPPPELVSVPTREPSM